MEADTMTDVFRIMDRFRIAERGTAFGREPGEICFLFCNHPLYPRRADEDYEEEFQAARKRGYSCALFSYEDLAAGELTLYGEEISGLTIYRGWMMKPAMYRDFYERLEKRGIALINAPEEYEHYHLLPRWYDDFKNETAESVWTAGDRVEDVLLAGRQLTGSWIVKDYVKSRKHEWYEACFIKNIQEESAFRKTAETFIARQGEDLVGGVVLRKYEKLRQIGFHEQSGMPLAEEYRVFVYAGRILMADDYWTDRDDVTFTEEEQRWIESIAARVKSNFVTVDLARREDGSLIIMEFGDGQVSGLQQIKAEEFYGAF